MLDLSEKTSTNDSSAGTTEQLGRHALAGSFAEPTLRRSRKLQQHRFQVPGVSNCFLLQRVLPEDQDAISFAFMTCASREAYLSEELSFYMLMLGNLEAVGSEIEEGAGGTWTPGCRVQDDMLQIGISLLMKPSRPHLNYCTSKDW